MIAMKDHGVTPARRRPPSPSADVAADRLRDDARRLALGDAEADRQRRIEAAARTLTGWPNDGAPWWVEWCGEAAVCRCFLCHSEARYWPDAVHTNACPVPMLAAALGVAVGA